MSVIEELLKDRHDDKIDYDELLKNFPWIDERDRYCVLSPDSDGLLCGLLMAKMRNWKIIGFYDDKVGLIEKNYISKDLVFLDGEIFRKQAKSMGHHMLQFNKKQNIDFSNFDNCIQPNLLRNYDGKHDFRLKYPLATIHMLVSILAYSDYKHGLNSITLTEKAVAPLFFTDGVFNVLFSYPENVLNWLSYLRINENWNPLKNIFENEVYSVFTTMKLMNEFFRERDKLSFGKERGDRLKISSKDGEPYNIELLNNGTSKLNDDAVNRIKEFLKLIGSMTNWDYLETDWICWNNLHYYKFTKEDFKKHGWTITNTNFEKFIALNPLSWAMTSGENIEFTLENPSKFHFSNNDTN